MTTNTPSEQPAIPEGWRPLGEAPPETPVIVQYRQWNLPNGEVREQVAWFYNGNWRPYPSVSAEAYADFWRAMPAIPASAGGAEAMREALQGFVDDLTGSLRNRTSMLTINHDALQKRITRARSALSLPVEQPAQASEDQIDAAAQYLRETQQSGKRLTPWGSTPRATKKKWLALAEGTLRAALNPSQERAGR